MNAETRATLAESLSSRTEQVPLRIGIGVGVAIAVLPIVGWLSPAWLVVWIAIQLTERAWIARHASAGALARAAHWGLALLFVSVSWFCAIASAAIFSDRLWGMIGGVTVLAGALMNAGPSTRRSQAAYITTLLAITPYVLLLPILAFLQKADPGEVWCVACASVLLILGCHSIRASSVRVLEGERRANASKSEFLATVSHEIRTPLNGVLGMAQAMQADDLNDRQRARLDTLRKSGETLLLLLNDVLDLSKIEAGKLELEDVEFELGPLIASACAVFMPIAAAKSLDLRVDVEDAAMGRYVGDGARIRQILANLLSNALKFTERGEVRVDVAREGETLRIRVIDTGMGIPEDRVARLFSKFEQLDASTTRKFGGSGLGLAISQTLAGLMGGKIEVESRAGHGSTFGLTLPLPRLGDEIGPAERPARAAYSREGATDLRVLAAEDNPVNQLVLRTLLEQAGVEPVIVNDGAEALEAWRSQVWDVILMDVQMPVMDGLAATRAIRGAENQTQRDFTPIIALTANAMSHQVEECLAAGMNLVVAKPIKIEALFAAMEQALERPESKAVA